MPDQDSSAFISYSREDSEFALRLAQDLKAAGAHVWLDQMDISPGVPWDNAIEDALNAAPMMLLVLSPSSSRSNNVRNEISFALEAGKVIIPVLYQDCVVPLRLQRNQRIDFRADYAKGLASLLHYLHVQNPDPEVLERAANGDAQRKAAWEAREAEARRLEERQKLEEETRQREDDERHRQEQAEIAAHEAEQRRLRDVAAQQAIEAAHRKAEAARIAEEQRLADKQAEANVQRLRQQQADGDAAVMPAPNPIPADIPVHPPVGPPPRKPDPIKPPPMELKPPPVLNDYSNRGLIKKKWQPAVTIAALAVALVIAIIVIIAIANNHPPAPTIVQGTGGSTDSTTQPSTQPATPPETAAAPAPIAPPAAATPAPTAGTNTGTTRSTAPNAKAKPQFLRSQAFGKQGNWVAAAQSGERALSLDPQSEDILQYISFIDHEQLFNFERAYELDQTRITLGYGQDDWVEANLTAGRFAQCANLAAEQWGKESEARLKIVMSALQFACMKAENNLLAYNIGVQLRKEVASLQKVGWTFNGTEHFVMTSPAFAPNGKTWAILFQALTNGDEKTALAALTALGITG